MSRRSRRANVSVEDPGNREEIPRSEEVKHYSRGFRQLKKRSDLGLIVGALCVAYAAYVTIYVFGIGELHSGTTPEGRKVFLLATSAVFLLFMYFRAPVAMMVYRSWWFRVSQRSHKKGLNKTG